MLGGFGKYMYLCGVMQWTDRIRQVKFILVVVAIIIAITSLLVSHFLVTDLSDEERNKMEVWARAMQTLQEADEMTDLALVLSVIQGNKTIPVIVLDSDEQVMDYRNVDIRDKDSVRYVADYGRRLYKAGHYIHVAVGHPHGVVGKAV